MADEFMRKLQYLHIGDEGFSPLQVMKIQVEVSFIWSSVVHDIALWFVTILSGKVNYCGSMTTLCA